MINVERGLRGWNLWVWLVGVVSRRWVYRFPHNITYPYSTCISSFLQHHSYLFVHFLNDFSFLFLLFLCKIANVAQRTIEIVQKLRWHGNIIISARMCTCIDYESRDFHV